MTAGKTETVVISKCMEFRIKPDMEQKVLIWKTFGCCRFVWNHLLDERIGYEKVHKGKLLNTTPAHLKKDNPFLCEVDSMALINTQLNLNQSCRKLFPKGKSPAESEPVMQEALPKGQVTGVQGKGKGQALIHHELDKQ